MKIFLTGATGFVGGYFLRQLLSDGHEVISHIRSTSGIKTIEKIGGKYYLGNLDDIKALQASLSGCDAVIHCAAYLNFGDLKKILKMPILRSRRISYKPQKIAKLKNLFLSVLRQLL